MAWRLETAKEHLDELIERARRHGPQVVTDHGKDVVVVLSVEEYKRLREAEPSLIHFIRSGPDFDLLDLGRATDHGRDLDP